MTRLPFVVKPYKAAAAPHLKFVVVGRSAGRRRKKFFRSQTEANTYARMKNADAVQFGADAAIPLELRVMAQRCQLLLAQRQKTIEDATAHFLKFLDQQARSCTVDQLFEELIAEKRQARFSGQYLACLKVTARRAREFFGAKLIAEITLDDVNEFLAQFRHYSAVTRNFYRQLLVIALGHAMRRRYCSENVAASSVVIKVSDKPVEILRPSELARLLAQCCPRILPLVAIGAFAGLRTAELSRLDWQEIKLRREPDRDGCFGYIEVTAAKAKSARRRLVKILPCLAAWLRPFARRNGRVSQIGSNRYQVLRLETAKRAMLRWPKNALRHSFATYHLAHFKNCAALALEMGHRSEDLIFDHYREVVTAEDAAEYWQIAPYSRQETARIHAFTPEAYPWFCKVTAIAEADYVNDVPDLAAYLGVACDTVWRWLREIDECPARREDGRFHLPTWLKFARTTKCARLHQAQTGSPLRSLQYRVESVMPRVGLHERDWSYEKHYFAERAEAVAWATEHNRKCLATELLLDEIENVIDFRSPNESHAGDNGLPLPQPQTNETALCGVRAGSLG
jgi:integrase